MGHLLPVKSSLLFLGLAISIQLAFHLANAAPLQSTEETNREKGCYFMMKHYNHGEKIDTNEACLNCTCADSTLMCYLRVCPFIKPMGEECFVEKDVNDCCPKFWCPKVYEKVTTEAPEEEETGCYLDGKYYQEGTRIPINPAKPCEVCYCIRNSSVCTMQECELKVEGCSPQYNSNSCCPSRYNCSQEAATTLPPLVLEKQEEKEGCLVDGKRYADGELVSLQDDCKHCYCMKHEVVCAVEDCKSPGEGCIPVTPKKGECCPHRYECHTTPSQITSSPKTDLALGDSTAEMGTIKASTKQTLEPSKEAKLAPEPTMMPTTTKEISSEEPSTTTQESVPTVPVMADETPTAVSLKPRVPKITDVPDSSLSSTGRNVTKRPVYFPSKPIPGEGICRHLNKTYANGEIVPSNDPCRTNCSCSHSVVQCDAVECTLVKPPGFTSCKAVKNRASECCPRFECYTTDTSLPNVTQTRFDATMTTTRVSIAEDTALEQVEFPITEDLDFGPTSSSFGTEVKIKFTTTGVMKTTISQPETKISSTETNIPADDIIQQQEVETESSLLNGTSNIFTEEQTTDEFKSITVAPETTSREAIEEKSTSVFTEAPSEKTVASVETKTSTETTRQTAEFVPSEPSKTTEVPGQEVTSTVFASNKTLPIEIEMPVQSEQPFSIDVERTTTSADILTDSTERTQPPTETEKSGASATEKIDLVFSAVTVSDETESTTSVKMTELGLTDTKTALDTEQQTTYTPTSVEAETKSERITESTTKISIITEKNISTKQQPEKENPISTTPPSDLEKTPTVLSTTSVVPITTAPKDASVGVHTTTTKTEDIISRQKEPFTDQAPTETETIKATVPIISEKTESTTATLINEKLTTIEAALGTEPSAKAASTLSTTIEETRFPADKQTIIDTVVPETSTSVTSKIEMPVQSVSTLKSTETTVTEKVKPAEAFSMLADNTMPEDLLVSSTTETSKKPETTLQPEMTQLTNTAASEKGESFMTDKHPPVSLDTTKVSPTKSMEDITVSLAETTSSKEELVSVSSTEIPIVTTISDRKIITEVDQRETQMTTKPVSVDIISLQEENMKSTVSKESSEITTSVPSVAEETSSESIELDSTDNVTDLTSSKAAISTTATEITKGSELIINTTTLPSTVASEKFTLVRATTESFSSEPMANELTTIKSITEMPDSSEVPITTTFPSVPLADETKTPEITEQEKLTTIESKTTTELAPETTAEQEKISSSETIVEEKFITTDEKLKETTKATMSDMPADEAVSISKLAHDEVTTDATKHSSEAEVTGNKMSATEKMTVSPTAAELEVTAPTDAITIEFESSVRTLPTEVSKEIPTTKSEELTTKESTLSIKSTTVKDFTKPEVVTSIEAVEEADGTNQTKESTQSEVFSTAKITSTESSPITDTVTQQNESLSLEDFATELSIKVEEDKEESPMTKTDMTTTTVSETTTIVAKTTPVNDATAVPTQMSKLPDKEIATTKEIQDIVTGKSSALSSKSTPSFTDMIAVETRTSTIMPEISTIHEILNVSSTPFSSRSRISTVHPVMDSKPSTTTITTTTILTTAEQELTTKKTQQESKKSTLSPTTRMIDLTSISDQESTVEDEKHISTDLPMADETRKATVTPSVFETVEAKFTDFTTTDLALNTFATSTSNLSIASEMTIDTNKISETTASTLKTDVTSTEKTTPTDSRTVTETPSTKIIAQTIPETAKAAELFSTTLVDKVTISGVVGSTILPETFSEETSTSIAEPTKLSTVEEVSEEASKFSGSPSSTTVKFVTSFKPESKSTEILTVVDNQEAVTVTTESEPKIQGRKPEIVEHATKLDEQSTIGFQDEKRVTMTDGKKTDSSSTTTSMDFSENQFGETASTIVEKLKESTETDTHPTITKKDSVGIEQTEKALTTTIPKLEKSTVFISSAEKQTENIITELTTHFKVEAETKASETKPATSEAISISTEGEKFIETEKTETVQGLTTKHKFVDTGITTSVKLSTKQEMDTVSTTEQTTQVTSLTKEKTDYLITLSSTSKIESETMAPSTEKAVIFKGTTVKLEAESESSIQTDTMTEISLIKTTSESSTHITQPSKSETSATEKTTEIELTSTELEKSIAHKVGTDFPIDKDTETIIPMFDDMATMKSDETKTAEYDATKMITSSLLVTGTGKSTTDKSLTTKLIGSTATVTEVPSLIKTATTEKSEIGTEIQELPLVDEKESTTAKDTLISVTSKTSETSFATTAEEPKPSETTETIKQEMSSISSDTKETDMQDSVTVETAETTTGEEKYSSSTTTEKALVISTAAVQSKETRIFDIATTTITSKKPVTETRTDKPLERETEKLTDATSIKPETKTEILSNTEAIQISSTTKSKEEATTPFSTKISKITEIPSTKMSVEEKQADETVTDRIKATSEELTEKSLTGEASTEDFEGEKSTLRDQSKEITEVASAETSEVMRKTTPFITEDKNTEKSTEFEVSVTEATKSESTSTKTQTIKIRTTIILPLETMEEKTDKEEKESTKANEMFLTEIPQTPSTITKLQPETSTTLWSTKTVAETKITTTEKPSSFADVEKPTTSRIFTDAEKEISTTNVTEQTEKSQYDDDLTSQSKVTVSTPSVNEIAKESEIISTIGTVGTESETKTTTVKSVEEDTTIAIETITTEEKENETSSSTLSSSTISIAKDTSLTTKHLTTTRNESLTPTPSFYSSEETMTPIPSVGTSAEQNKSMSPLNETITESTSNGITSELTSTEFPIISKDIYNRLKPVTRTDSTQSTKYTTLLPLETKTISQGLRTTELLETEPRYQTQKPVEYSPSSFDSNTEPELLTSTTETTACIENGITYSDGESIPAVDPCETCHCALGQLVCWKQQCQLPSPGCIPRAGQEDKCCPVAFDCQIDTASSDGSFTQKDMENFTTVPSTLEKEIITTGVPDFKFSEVTFIKSDIASTVTTEKSIGTSLQTEPEIRLFSTSTAEENVTLKSENITSTDEVERPRTIAASSSTEPITERLETETITKLTEITTSATSEAVSSSTMQAIDKERVKGETGSNFTFSDDRNAVIISSSSSVPAFESTTTQKSSEETAESEVITEETIIRTIKPPSLPRVQEFIESVVPTSLHQSTQSEVELKTKFLEENVTTTATITETTKHKSTAKPRTTKAEDSVFSFVTNLHSDFGSITSLSHASEFPISFSGFTGTSMETFSKQTTPVRDETTKFVIETVSTENAPTVSMIEMETETHFPTTAKETFATEKESLPTNIVTGISPVYNAPEAFSTQKDFEVASTDHMEVSSTSSSIIGEKITSLAANETVKSYITKDTTKQVTAANTEERIAESFTTPISTKTTSGKFAEEKDITHITSRAEEIETVKTVTEKSETRMPTAFEIAETPKATDASTEIVTELQYEKETNKGLEITSTENIAETIKELLELSTAFSKENVAETSTIPSRKEILSEIPVTQKIPEILKLSSVEDITTTNISEISVTEKVEKVSEVPFTEKIVSFTGSLPTKTIAESSEMSSEQTLTETTGTTFEQLTTKASEILTTEKLLEIDFKQRLPVTPETTLAETTAKLLETDSTEKISEIASDTLPAEKTTEIPELPFASNVSKISEIHSTSVEPMISVSPSEEKKINIEKTISQYAPESLDESSTSKAYETSKLSTEEEIEMFKKISTQITSESTDTFTEKTTKISNVLSMESRKEETEKPFIPFIDVEEGMSKESFTDTSPDFSKTLSEELVTEKSSVSSTQKTSPAPDILSTPQTTQIVELSSTEEKVEASEVPLMVKDEGISGLLSTKKTIETDKTSTEMPAQSTEMLVTEKKTELSEEATLTKITEIPIISFSEETTFTTNEFSSQKKTDVSRDLAKTATEKTRYTSTQQAVESASTNKDDTFTEKIVFTTSPAEKTSTSSTTTMSPKLSSSNETELPLTKETTVSPINTISPETSSVVTIADKSFIGETSPSSSSTSAEATVSSSSTSNGKDILYRKIGDEEKDFKISPLDQSTVMTSVEMSEITLPEKIVTPSINETAADKTLSTEGPPVTINTIKAIVLELEESVPIAKLPKKEEGILQTSIVPSDLMSTKMPYTAQPSELKNASKDVISTEYTEKVVTISSLQTETASSERKTSSSPPESHSTILSTTLNESTFFKDQNETEAEVVTSKDEVESMETSMTKSDQRTDFSGEDSEDLTEGTKLIPETVDLKSRISSITTPSFIKETTILKTDSSTGINDTLLISTEMDKSTTKATAITITGSSPASEKFTEEILTSTTQISSEQSDRVFELITSSSTVSGDIYLRKLTPDQDDLKTISVFDSGSLANETASSIETTKSVTQNETVQTVPELSETETTKQDEIKTTLTKSQRAETIPEIFISSTPLAIVSTEMAEDALSRNLFTEFLPNDQPDVDTEKPLSHVPPISDSKTTVHGKTSNLTTPDLTQTTTPLATTENFTTQAMEDFALDEGSCIFYGRVYQSAEQITRQDPCEFCFCFRSDVICLQQSCPPPVIGCHDIPVPGYCCPRYECPIYVTAKNITETQRRTYRAPVYIRDNKREKRETENQVEVTGCEVKGEFYEIGQTVKSASGPCLQCRCDADSMMRCEPQKCRPEPPLMMKMNPNFFRTR